MSYLDTIKINRLDKKKANKKQEDWIVPTLLNGLTSKWEALPVSYMKDDFGFVHFRGTLEGGWENNDIAFTLPLEYRPNNYSYFVCGSGSVVHQVNITNRGDVQLKNTSRQFVGLESISFYAGVEE